MKRSTCVRLLAGLALLALPAAAQQQDFSKVEIKVVPAAGLRVRLVDAPFEQPLGARSAIEIWNRPAGG